MLQAGELKWSVVRALRELGVTFQLSETAPDTFERLKAECTSRKLVVWPGASEATIYGDAETNFAFRAWHDSIHLKANLPFTPEGEKEVCRIQCAQVESSAVARILHAEIVGQLEYQAKFGHFPVDQKSFVETYLKRGGVR